jgi:hypothetical protein
MYIGAFHYLGVSSLEFDETNAKYGSYALKAKPIKFLKVILKRLGYTKVILTHRIACRLQSILAKNMDSHFKYKTQRYDSNAIVQPCKIW